MGKVFFIGWALWEKMTFVLACAIVLTVGAGLLKLWYDTWKINKYTKRDAAKGKTPAMVEAGDDEVPFGIKALHQGIEVEGVWISRTNTPATSRRGSVDSPRLTDPAIMQALQHGLQSKASTGSFSDASSFDRAVSAERLPSRPSSFLPPSPGLHGQRDPSTSSMLRNSIALDQLEGRQESEVASRETNDYSSGADSFLQRPYGSLLQPPEEVHPALRGGQPLLQHSSTDLDMLQNHRLSHVAETGQLTPRLRPRYTGEWASVAESSSRAASGEYFTARGAPAPLNLGDTGNPFKSSMDGLTPSISADQKSPTQETSLLADENQMESYVTAPTTNRSYTGGYAEVPQQPDDVPGPSNTRESFQAERDYHVLRTVNSSFQILRPGTFGLPNPEPDPKERRQSKLQKKRRSSQSSHHLSLS